MRERGNYRQRQSPARARTLKVRFSEEEYAAVAAAAKQARMTPTGYIGTVAVEAAEGRAASATRQRALKEALVELMQTRTQVSKFGANVNQAVAQLHSTGEAPAWLSDAVAITTRATARLDAAAAKLERRIR